MTRYIIELSYKGTAYNGWQIQPNAPSVQGTLERRMSQMLRQPISVVGAGRTDTGVHASYYVAHFDAEGEITPEFTYHLNCALPHDIAIMRIVEAPDDFHARFGAVRREYKYYISTVKNPFNRDLAFTVTNPLDIEAMNSAAECLLNYSDFTTFSKLHSGNKTNICKVMEARWDICGEMLIFTIAADRFLRNMVRSIVGTLYDVGRGKLSASDFGRILHAEDRSLASSSAPAGGLYLSDIEYLPTIKQNIKL